MESIVKQTKTQLGRLASQFFAYIQLKNRDIICTGEIAPVLGLTANQERTLLFRLADSGWIVRMKRGVYLVPPRIPSGGRYGPGSALIVQKLMAVEGAVYQLCGPTAFNFYGFTEQISNITYVYNDCISGLRAIGGLQFQFIKIASERLGGTQVVKIPEGQGVVYGSKARILMDTVYDWSRFNSLPMAYGWIEQAIEDDRKLARNLVDDTIKYGNQATARRLGYLLDRLGCSKRIVNRLQVALSDSRALIPWIPGKSSKGSIDRTWGVIINGKT
jgi:predicted transcriptional regulator of viral defense system